MSNGFNVTNALHGVVAPSKRFRSYPINWLAFSIRLQFPTTRPCFFSSFFIINLSKYFVFSSLFFGSSLCLRVCMYFHYYRYSGAVDYCDFNICYAYVFIYKYYISFIIKRVIILFNRRRCCVR